MNETTEQVKHTPEGELFSLPRLKEAKRILGSPNRAYELLNLIGVRDELLEALRECVNGLNCQPGYIRSQTLMRASAAIAKAEGRR